MREAIWRSRLNSSERGLPASFYEAYPMISPDDFIAGRLRDDKSTDFDTRPDYRGLSVY